MESVAALQDLQLAREMAPLLKDTELNNKDYRDAAGNFVSKTPLKSEWLYILRSSEQMNGARSSQFVGQ